MRRQKNRRCGRKSRRAIVGIEAAIVLIAFVVIASALAYVVINMGFFSAQKAKETITRGVQESTSALQLDGSVMGKTNQTRHLVYLLFPVKLSVGKSEVDLHQDTIVLSIGGSVILLDVYKGVVNESAVGLTEDPSDLDEILTKVFPNVSTPAAFAILYNDDNDTVLENFEKAFFLIDLGNRGLREYDIIKIEVKTGSGAALMIQRSVPGGLPEKDYVDLN
ncbi:MAG: archaellin/type IV pilin N-terminal domain-containing protein [Nitrososphaerota archaeon]|nr:flagellin [Candidatus Bathyarchaeota archaeon]MDW8048368.1 archaellin/type IV pilin N-terminal domain-containing protein [Nitrososphaerota archaeon]